MNEQQLRVRIHELETELRELKAQLRKTSKPTSKTKQQPIQQSSSFMRMADSIVNNRRG